MKLTLATLCLLLVGCQRQEEGLPAAADSSPVGVEIRVAGVADYTDGEAPATRALTAGMRFRVEVQAGVNGVNYTLVAYADYIYTPGSGVAPADGDAGLVLPGAGVGTSYRFVAYSYNRMEAITNVPGVRVVPVALGDDFLACSQYVVADKHLVLDLRFRHLMSRVRVEIRSDKEIEQCMGMLMDVPGTCVWGQGDGTLFPEGGSRTNVDLTFTDRGTTLVSDPVLLIPDGVMRTQQVMFPFIVIGGKSYQNSVGTLFNAKWEVGADHLYKLKLR